LETHIDLLHSSAKQLLTDQFDVATFNQKEFMKKSTDIIAIDRSLATKMRQKWLNVG
jgi:hypothetical protein